MLKSSHADMLLESIVLNNRKGIGCLLNTSSRIEGTRTEMDEAVMDEAAIRPERRDDWREVRNYVQAMIETAENGSLLSAGT